MYMCIVFQLDIQKFHKLFAWFYSMEHMNKG